MCITSTKLEGVLSVCCKLVSRWLGCSQLSGADKPVPVQVPRLVETIRKLSKEVGEDPGQKPYLRRAVHTLTEHAKTGAKQAEVPQSFLIRLQAHSSRSACEQRRMSRASWLPAQCKLSFLCSPCSIPAVPVQMKPSPVAVQSKAYP